MRQVNGYAGVRLLPNAITVLALCSGLSSVQFALSGHWELAVAAIAVAGVFDSLDGRIARLLDATSKMGAELDSLADCVSFGVSPALVLFIWQLKGHQFGWTVALVFAVCAALRLARFNTLIDDVEQPPYAKEFFVGVPAPAAALVATLPLLLFLQFGDGWWTEPSLISVWILLVAALMISRIRTLSMKTVRVPQKFIAPLLVLVGFVAAAVINAPFLMLSVSVLVYLLHLPYSVHRYQWLGRHPEAWHLEARQRRAAVRALRATRSPGNLPPLRRRVAGAARRRVAGARAGRRRIQPPLPGARLEPLQGTRLEPRPDPALGERLTSDRSTPAAASNRRRRLGLRRNRGRTGGAPPAGAVPPPSAPPSVPPDAPYSAR